MSRYSEGPAGDDEFQAGSSRRVLKNKLGLVDPHVIGLVESELLHAAQLQSYEQFDSTKTLSMSLVRELHHLWLGSLYPFAGQIRTVNLAKNGISFAPLAFLEGTLKELDSVFAKETPCQAMAKARLVRAIAHVHVESVLAHQFREGNGRVSRWAADRMALQAGYPALEWEFDVQTEVRRHGYFAALEKGFLLGFSALEQIVEQALARALRSVADPSDER